MVGVRFIRKPSSFHDERPYTVERLRQQLTRTDGRGRKSLHWFVGGFISIVMLSFSIASAQEAVVERAAARQATRERAADKKAPHEHNQNASPSKDEKSKGTESDKAESENGEDKEKDEEQDNSVKRPKTPPRVPDPREFDVRPDKNALVRFDFHGQPWPDALQWLAVIGGYSLDWQELPDDYINLSTERHYTIPETRDLFNRLLIERGYTMVLQGDVMSVVKLDKLDPSLLPRVEDESQLLDLPAHDFVKITFQLPHQLKADQAAADVKPLLSSSAKVQPLMATNRLLVIDMVGNLREVSRLVNSEHAAATGNEVPREFPIRFARADHVADQIMILLGLDPSSRRTPEELRVEQQRLQLFTQMQQKGKDMTKYLRKGDAPLVFLAVNHRNNSILANAPAAEMAIIQRSVDMLDTPSGSLAGAMPGEMSMDKYQLVALTPQSILTALEEMGDLDPRTRLKIDSDAKALFAQATARDHQKIQAMIDRLDGTGRQFEVIWLRRLPADAVAKTIHDLMVGKEDEKDNNRRSYSYYGYRDYSNRNKEKANAGFRVDADTENNRLLLWANDLELKEVRKFLEKLGEISGDSGNPNTVRLLDAGGAETTLRLLERLRRAWPTIGPNELRIEGVPPSPAEQEEQKSPEIKTEASASQDLRAAMLGRNDNLATPHALGWYTRLVQATQGDIQRAAVTGESGEQPRGAKNGPTENDMGDHGDVPPPITITFTEDGRMILSSRDTQALDRLEDLIAQIAPPAKDYDVFYLRYALASMVTINLEEYFDEESDSNGENDYWRGWYGFDMRSSKKGSTGVGLSQRRKIRFIYDYDTNSILVSNANPQQLETVEALIEIYDKPPSEDSISARRFQIFKLNYARATPVAQTIKEVYRDLLSSKDKAFENAKGKGEKEQSSQMANYYRIYGSSDTDKKPKKVKASFAGALSVGVDEISNSVIVSAQEEWMSSIEEMIKYLDKEALPNIPTVEVISTRVDPGALQAALSKALGTSGDKPDAAKQRPEQPPRQEGKDAIPQANAVEKVN